MAFFKFRKGGDESAAAPVQPESVETLRRRARHRLIGAAVLVGVGVLGFPLLFDTQPRPIDADIPIEIPDRNKARPLPLPAPVSAAPATQPAASPAPVPAVAARAAASAPARPVAAGAVTSAGAPAKPESGPEPTIEVRADARAEPKAQVKGDGKPDTADAPKPLASASKSPPAATVQAAARPAADADTNRARALLEGKPAQPATAAVEGRFVVQVGAFADPSKARETRLRVERAGLKTYTHVAETKAGKRTRVRVGPFETRAEADKAAGRIKALDLPAAILTL